MSLFWLLPSVKKGMRDVKRLSLSYLLVIFPCVLPWQLEPVYSLFINCILYFLSRSFQFNSRNLEMNVNSVEVTNFRQILTLLRALIMEMCGLFRVVTSQNTLPIYATLAFDFRSGEGRGNISAPSSLCFQNMDERLAGRIVPKYHSSCWFSLFLLLVFHSLVISEGNNSFRFWNQKFLLLIYKAHSLNSQSGNNFTFVYLQSGVLHLLNHAVYILKSYLFCCRCIF